MNAMSDQRPDALGRASVEACTLPTTQRLLRVAEFDDLFAGALSSVEHRAPTRARLLFTGDPALGDRVQQLADRESSCCSFFAFGVSVPEPGRVALDIEVPPAYADVLDGLVARADAVLAAS